MSITHYPRVETIVVPENVPPNDIGKYVSSRSNDILTELGTSTFNPKSMWLRPLSERFFVLGFDSTMGSKYVIPTSKELHAKDGSEPKLPDVVEGASPALRYKGSPDSVRSKKASVGTK